MNFRKWIVPGIVVLVVVGFAALLVAGLNAKEAPTGASGVARVSHPANDFTMQTFDGGEITLSGLKGQPVIVNFWASWCPPCREEATTLERTWQKYKDQGVTFIGVDIQDKLEDGLDYVSEYHVTYPNGQDLDGRITIDYGVGGIPVTFFIDKDGMISSRWVGAISQSLLEERIEELLK